MIGSIGAALFRQSGFTPMSGVVFAQIDSLKTSNKLTLSNANLTYKTNTGFGAYGMANATMGIREGQWCWEVTVDQAGQPVEISGIADRWLGSAASNVIGQFARGVGYRGVTWGISKYFTAFVTQGTGPTIAVGGKIMYALDATAGTLMCFYNGVQYGGTVTGLPANVTWYPAFNGTNVNNDGGTVNFGQTAFAFPPPVGYNYGVYTPIGNGTFDPSFTAMTLSGGNLIATATGTSVVCTRSTTSHSSGKHYFEVKCTTNTNFAYMGLQTSANLTSNWVGQTSTSYGARIGTGQIRNNGSIIATPTTTPVQGDVVGFACDFTGLTVSMYVNNALVATFSIAAGTYYIGVSSAGSFPEVFALNVGASGFAYTLPTGYSAW